MTRAKNIIKPSQAKPTAPTTRDSTCATTQKAKEKTKQVDQGGKFQKRPRRKYVAQDKSNEEKTESDDNNQFKVVSHNPL